MNGGIAPLLLLGAAFGLVMSFAQWRAALVAFAIFAATAVLASFLPIAGKLQDPLIAGLLASTLASAALVYLPKGVPAIVGWIAAANDGAWLGLFASVSQHRNALALAVPMGLLLLPGQWIVTRGYPIVIKVVCSWLIAIAALAIFVSLVPTPGYKPDHME